MKKNYFEIPKIPATYIFLVVGTYVYNIIVQHIEHVYQLIPRIGLFVPDILCLLLQYYIIYSQYYTIAPYRTHLLYIWYSINESPHPRGRLRAVEPLPKGNLNVTLEKMETNGPRCASVYTRSMCPLSLSDFITTSSRR